MKVTIPSRMTLPELREILLQGSVRRWASYLGVSFSTIQHIRDGKDVKASTLARIAEKLEVEILIGGPPPVPDA